MQIAVVSLLMVLTFRFNLWRLWLKTNWFTGESNWQHSMMVPIIGLYYLYINRRELLAAPVRRTWVGLAPLLLGLFLFAYGIWPGQNDFIKDFGMVITLFGVVLMLCGWRVMRTAWFPIAFLVCAIPWPGLAYSKLAGPLQHLAANVAVQVLKISGVDAASSGTKIFIGIGSSQAALNVAEACAGLRSLMTFVAVGGAVAFLSSRPMWQKLFISVSAIPIAIFCNVLRVSGQGLLHHYWSPELSRNFAHQFVGLIMLIPAFFLILGVGWFLDQLFIEETDGRTNAKILRRGPAMPQVALKPAGTAVSAPAMKPAVAAPDQKATTPPPATARPAALRPMVPPPPSGAPLRRPPTPRPQPPRSQP